MEISNIIPTLLMCLVIKIHEIEIATLQHCNFAQLFGRVNGIWEGDIYIRISLREDIYINIYRYLYKYLLLTPLPLSHWDSVCCNVAMLQCCNLQILARMYMNSLIRTCWRREWNRAYVWGFSPNRSFSILQPLRLGYSG